MASRKRPASRGFVNNIILESLLSGDKYGYEIIKEVEEKSNGKIVLKQPSLYSSLKRFETKGYITSYWGDSDIGGRRHYYTITELGKNYYNKTINKNYDLDEEDEDSFESDAEQISFDKNEKVFEQPEISEENAELDEETSEKEYNIFDLLENSNKQKVKNLNPSSTPHPQKENVRKETSIQVDMFTTSQQNEINKEEKVNVEHIQQLKLNDEHISPAPQANVEDKKDIPLIKEQPQEFFSWEDLKRKHVQNNIEEKQETLKQEEIKPIKNQIVMDEYGILKIGDEQQQKVKQQKIFDNVGIRIDYKDPVIKQEPAKPQKVEPELTEEERELLNRNFNKKYDEIITNKTNIEQPSKEIDYKNILGDLLAPENEEVIEPNNHANEDEISDEIIDQAIVQANNYNYSAPKHNQVVNEDGFKFKPFVTEVDEEEKQTNIVLINKVRLNYGIFMFVLMVLQISTLLIAINSQSLQYKSDYLLYGLAYGIALIVLIFCVSAYFIAPDKRKSNTFKLSYSLIFGILLFLSACALTYAINTFIGLNSSNVALFSTKLLLPIILSINFILTPLIYKMILSDKKVY